jgi:myo-inositol-1(or 4)-monophosphatase
MTVHEAFRHSMNDIEIAKAAAKRGAEVLLKYWEQLGKEDADIKSRNDWVSRADRESEKAIVDTIHELSPGDAILAEETGASAGQSDRTWIIDPLDGTSNYLQHFPVWSVSIALRTKNEMTAGLVYEPLREIFFTAERGAGAFRDD